METRGFPSGDELTRFIAIQRSLNHPQLVGDYTTVYLVPSGWSLSILREDPRVTRISTTNDLTRFLSRRCESPGLLVDHSIPNQSIAAAMKTASFQNLLFADRLDGRGLPPDPPPDANESFQYSEDWAERMRKWSIEGLNEERLPQAAEVCVVAHPEIAKSAALLYDRIYVPSHRGSFDHEWKDLPPVELTFGGDEELISLAYWWLDPRERMKRRTRMIAEHYQTKGLVVVPAYHSANDLDAGMSTGGFEAYQAAFRSIPVVDDAALSWDQVLEFRKDADTRLRHREFRDWLRYALNAKSLDEARERIEIRLERYEAALHKHGMKTTLGTIAQVWDSRTTISTAGASLLASAIAGAGWPAILGGLMIAGRFAIEVMRMQIDHDQFKASAPGREIAYLYEVRNRFS